MINQVPAELNQTDPYVLISAHYHCSYLILHFYYYCGIGCKATKNKATKYCSYSQLFQWLIWKLAAVSNALGSKNGNFASISVTTPLKFCYRLKTCVFCWCWGWLETEYYRKYYRKPADYIFDADFRCIQIASIILGLSENSNKENVGWKNGFKSQNVVDIHKWKSDTDDTCSSV